MTKEQLKEWRQRFGLTQDDVAEMFGVTRNTIQNWEAGLTAMPSTLEMGCEVWTDRLRKQMADLGPVTLIYSDGPMFINPYGPRHIAQLKQEPFPTNAAALARVKRLWGEPGFDGPFVIEEDRKPLWNRVELMRVVDGNDKGAPTVRNTITKVAKYVMKHSHIYVRGKEIPSEDEVAERKAKIEWIGKELEELAARAETEVVEYTHFEALLRKLHELSFFPTDRLVSDVAHACEGEKIAARV
jgi:transposase